MSALCNTDALRFLLVALFFFMTVEGIAEAQPETDISDMACATVTLLAGESTVTMPSSEQRSIVSGEAICAGGILNTGGNSRMELTFADSSIVRMDKNSSIELAIDTGDREKRVRRFQAKLLKGELWITQPGPSEGYTTLQILMADALLVGDRSVFRAVLFQDGAAEMKVYSGYVTASGPFMFVREASRFLLQPKENEAIDAAEPWRYRVEPYRKMIIQASGKETKPFSFAARADLSDWVRWNQQRDADIK